MLVKNFRRNYFSVGITIGAVVLLVPTRLVTVGVTVPLIGSVETPVELFVQ